MNLMDVAKQFGTPIAALVMGSALPYKKLVASVDEQPNAGPGVELDPEPF